MHVTFDHVEKIAEGIKTFWFRPEAPTHYLAGQFTELYLPHDNPDNRGQRRWFTLSSSPTDPLVSITTSFAAKAGSTFKRELAALRPGAALHLADPMGDFVLPKDSTIPLVFVAAGLGITPVHSIIKWLRDTNDQRQVQLLYAASTPERLAFDELFKSYKMGYTPVVSNSPAGYRGEGGHLTSERIMQLVGDDDRSLVYISGPEVMVEVFVRELTAAGVNTSRIVEDYFPGYLQV